MTTERNRFRRTGVARAVFTVMCGAASMMVAHEALAQQTLQRVEVTGTNIRRTDTETASPIQVITKDEIDQSGKNTVGDYLQTLTADGQGSVPTTYGRGFAGATASGISLRGLGANATLVLVNGRRVSTAVLADDAQRSFVDLDSLPLEAVERIEVVKDGASSIYGSDAVAGVVNIILKKNFVGTTVKASYGISEEGDGGQPRASLTHGMGDLDKDGYNFLVNVEMGRKEAIYYNDRKGRNQVGMSALTPLGFGHSQAGSNNVARLGGNGVIPTDANGNIVNNSTTQSIIGNVRNPATLNFYSRGNPNGVGFTRQFPLAQQYCNTHANLPQNDPGGGCVTDLWMQTGQVMPDSHNSNLYGRFTKRLAGDHEAFVEAGYYQTASRVQITGIVPNGTIIGRDGSVSSNAAAFQLGAAHPDNPYFGTAARLSYNPTNEIGARVISSDSHTVRFTAGLKGTMLGNWDYDTAIHYSEAKQTDTQERAINWRVANALVNPTAANVAAASANSAAYAALPAGTIWRIAENSNLNSAAMYDALLVDQDRSGSSKLMYVDFKASTFLGKLEGGDIGLALGAEFRREENELGFYNGLGDYIGLSYTAYAGKRNIFATFAEINAPITKQLEAIAALRFDNYSDAGSSWTPKVGAKWRPIDTLAVRGTYAHAFRAPSAAENGANSVAAFGGAVVSDTARIAAGVPNQTAVAPTFIQRGNPDLEPEKSKSFTIGAVWDATPTTSFTTDLWQIKRKGLPVIEEPQSAVDAGRVIRDPATSTNPQDPGAILTGFVQFVNANDALTRGIDVEANHRMNLGNGMGRLTFRGTWTHLLKQEVTLPDGTKYEYAGSHGDCHITNCIGSPRNKIVLAGTWDWNQWRFGAIVNYRGSMSARDPQDHPNGCAFNLPNGTPSPDGCKIKSFTTLDLSATYKIGQKTEIFGTITNATDAKPPFDPITYGAIGYNPLDFWGAVGRYYRIGVKHNF
jgi:iron complex outermembrane receptor protein